MAKIPVGPTPRPTNGRRDLGSATSPDRGAPRPWFRSALRPIFRKLSSSAGVVGYCRVVSGFSSMSSSKVVVLRELPVPTGDVLMRAIAAGEAEVRVWSERFRSWPPEHAVPQFVMNALDPLLLEAVVGLEPPSPLISRLRAHYARVRERYPGPFADVENVWRQQRDWWVPFLVSDADASSEGLGSPEAPELDVLALHPVLSHTPAQRRERRSARSSSRTGGERSPGPGRSSPGSAGGSGDAPARPSTEAPVDSRQAVLPASDASAPDDGSPDPVHESAASTAAAAGSGAAAGGSSHLPRARPDSATPVRPRTSGLVPSAAHRSVPVAGSSSRHGSLPVVSSASQASGVSSPTGRARVAVAASSSRTGRFSLGRSARELLDAAYVSPAKVRALQRRFVVSGNDMLDLTDWRVSEEGYKEHRERVLSRDGSRGR